MKTTPIATLVALAGLVPLSVQSATHQVPSSFSTITAALAAASAGDTVQVAAGTYAPSGNGETFPLSLALNSIVLSGAGMDACVLDAEGTGSVVVHDAAIGGRITGFRITGGSAGSGGGIRVNDGDPEIDHCYLVGNGAVNRGSAIVVNDVSAPWIHHNVIWDNFDTDLGDEVDPHGVIFQGQTTGVFEHNLVGRIDGNGLLTSIEAAPSVRHNIFYENGISGPSPRGRGICWFSTLDAVVFHNMFHANVIAAILWPAAGANFSGEAANDVDTTDAVYGNLDDDPLLVDPDAEDYRLQPASPAIDAGDPGLPFDPDGTIADLGPFYLDQTAVSVRPVDVESGISLSSAPNPFRSTTQIRFRLPERTAVRIDVFDTVGRRIRTLEATTHDEGAHAISWDGRDAGGTRVGSGVYFVRVRTPGATGALPLILLR